MARVKYIRARGTMLWARLQDEHGKWISKSTGCRVGDEDGAQRYVAAFRKAMDRKRAALAAGGSDTVKAYAKLWLVERQALDVDWTADRGRLAHHILPIIGDLTLAEVRLKHIADMVRVLRTTKSLAPRTIRNIYSVASALFRDARLAELIDVNPCGLDSRQLGEVTDKDSEWRGRAVFDVGEVVTLISDERIPVDRHVVYALELLAGVRPGETAALRWRHWDVTTPILGQLTVANAYSTRKNRQKSTKTKSVKFVPVHPTLAAMLAEWRGIGWPAMFGRTPQPDDLIVPLPPDAASSRRSRQGEPFRGYDYSGKRWREADLPALGWRQRRHYDMRATFITLALEHGADPLVIESRVTHTKKTRTAFDGYNRGRQWEATCREVAKLAIVRPTRYAAVTVVESSTVKMVEAAGVESPSSVAPTRDDLGVSLSCGGRRGSLSTATGTRPRYTWLARAAYDLVAPFTQENSNEIAEMLEARGETSEH
jgi:integrase